MTEKSEALRLADVLMTLFPSREDGERAAAELRRLSAENDLLGSAADKIRLFWRNEVHRLLAQRDALLEALKEITPSMPPADAPCHYGIVPQEKCGHCERIAKARAAIKMVEGE